MENLVYLVVGLIIGLAFGVTIGWALWRNKDTIRPNPAKDYVICGACQNPILEPPLKVVITDTTAFRYFKCRQCGTDVTAPV